MLIQMKTKRISDPSILSFFKLVLVFHAAKNFKIASDEKLLIVSIYPKVPEVNNNLKKILDDLQIEAVELLVSADIMMHK
jgi:hypothetical protein